MAHMKSWHVVVLQGSKTILDRETFSVDDSRTIYKDVKAKYDALNLEGVAAAKADGTKFVAYVVKREWY